MTNVDRIDLMGKMNIHEERICQLHFESSMFTNEFRNRLHQSAVPTLYLTCKPPQLLDSIIDNLQLALFNVSDDCEQNEF